MSFYMGALIERTIGGTIESFWGVNAGETGLKHPDRILGPSQRLLKAALCQRKGFSCGVFHVPPTVPCQTSAGGVIHLWVDHKGIGHAWDVQKIKPQRNQLTRTPRLPQKNRVPVNWTI